MTEERSSMLVSIKTKLMNIEIRVILAFFVVVSLIWVFFILANAVNAGTTQKLDVKIIEYFRNPADNSPAGPVWLPDVMRDITSLGGGTVITIITLIVIFYLIINKKYNASLKIHGYIEFVYELINISDVVITKCGASTFMEIIISGKIPVITSYIWEQEKGNKDFVVRNEMGVYVKKIRDLHKVLDNVLSKKEVYERNIENAGIRNGAEEVADFLSVR